MADEQPVTPLSQAFPSLQPNTSGSSNSTATETPFGATKANPLGIEAPAVAGQRAINRDLLAGTLEQGENQLSRAILQQDRAGAEQAAGGDALGEMHDFIAKHKEATDRDESLRRVLYDRIEKASQPHDYWADKSWWDKALAHIQSGLLGFGTGKPVDMVRELAEQDTAKQKAQLDNLMNLQKVQGANSDATTAVFDKAHDYLNGIHILKLKKVAAEYDKLGAMATTVEAKTNAKIAADTLRKQIVAEELKYQEGRRIKSSKAATHAMKAPAPAKQD